MSGLIAENSFDAGIECAALEIERLAVEWQDRADTFRLRMIAEDEKGRMGVVQMLRSKNTHAKRQAEVYRRAAVRIRTISGPTNTPVNRER